LILALVLRRAEGEHRNQIGRDVCGVVRAADGENAFAGGDVLEDRCRETVGGGVGADGEAGCRLVDPVRLGFVLETSNWSPSLNKPPRLVVGKSFSDEQRTVLLPSICVGVCGKRGL